MGKAREAVDCLLKAVATSSAEPDSTIYDHLGDAYAAAKDMDKAREAWAKSLSIEANDKVKRKLDESKAPQPDGTSL
jgi:predicted negative regulator of RcsB-dependent stress response